MPVCIICNSRYFNSNFKAKLERCDCGYCVPSYELADERGLNIQKLRDRFNNRYNHRVKVKDDDKENTRDS